MTDADPCMHPALIRMLAARDFPVNTCPASRHAAEIGEAMITHEDEVMALIDDFAHAGESILITVAALWEARSQLQTARTGLRAACDLLNGLHDDDLNRISGIDTERCNALLQQVRVYENT